ncbi:MAG TPA: amino acid adenylation domain-containing protein, partial [Thermoanaerobaculia bacterium]|nr:amino acid adenylation domain-containing protein [Thermoanaerobaculia bacterium]
MTEPRDIAGLSPEQRALLMLRMRRKAAQQEEPAAAVIPRVARGGPLPLSFAQQRLWFLDRWAPESPAYNVPAAVLFRGDLDVGAFVRALTTIVHRHETLRTTFPAVDGEPRQVIAPPGPLPVPLIDLTALSAVARHEETQRLAGREAGLVFDLRQGPLLRARLLRLDRREHVVLFNMHHIISDGWSVGVLIHELSELYGAFHVGRPAPLPPLPVQYADFAVWQRDRLRGEELERQLAYWRGRLGETPPALELPTDRPRPAARGFHGRFLTFPFPDGLWKRIEALGQGQRITPFMVTLAAFAALLQRLTGQDDMALGTPVAGRNRQELEGLIGFFVNTLALRAGLAGDPTFAELLARTREEVLGAFAHQELPFEKLVEELQPRRSLDVAPIFQVTFSLQNMPMGRPELPGVELESLSAETGATRVDLGLDIRPIQPVEARWEYATDLFDPPTVQRMSGHFCALLAAAVANPGLRLAELPLLSAAERHQLLLAWNDTEREYERHLTAHELFDLQAERAPDAVAVVAPDLEQWTYAGLARRSAWIARRLRAAGLGPEEVVGLAVERSPDLIAAMLGIARAGGAYLPLDPAYPEARLTLMLDEAAVNVVVAGTAELASLPAFAGREVLDLEKGGGASPPGRGEVESGGGQVGGSLLYVMYTSGSTGRPKGVAIPHRGVVRLARGGGHARLAAGEVILQIAPASFDASTFEIWGTLLNGGTLVLMPPGRPTLDGLAATLNRCGVTTLHLTSGLFQAVVDERLDALSGLRQLLFGGDVVSPAHVRRAAAALPDCELWACYGPTEMTTFTSSHPARRGHLERSVPIGRPIADTRVYVLDRGLAPVPVGVVGELAAGGAGLARGYLGRPDLTAERFVPDPCGNEPGARVYRTGDLVWFLPDGTLEILGRVDDQVKLRGFRVEPREVEAALLGHPAVARAAVLVLGERGSSLRLVAYVQAERAAPEDLRAWLRERVPDFMMPSAVVRVPALPLTANGKVDRRALAVLALEAPDGERGEEETPLVPLRGPVEEALGGIWAEVLGRERIGARDGFFDLGGHSLLAIRVLSRVRQAFGVELPLRALFEEPTLSGLARRVELALDGAPPPPPIAPAPRGQGLPLSFAQQRLWFIDQLEPDSAVYNTPFFLRLTGELDVPALAAAFADVVERHEVLRTTFTAAAGSSAVQLIGRPFAPDLPVMDLGGLSPEIREAEARRLATLEAGSPFDLRRGPVLRISLLRLAAGDHVLLVNAHHIATDAWSMEVLWREVSVLYAGLRLERPAALPPLPIQYADFAVWQRGWLQGEVLESQLDYWRSRLGDGPSVVELPADRPRPAVQSYRGADLPLALPAAASAALNALARREGATPFMTLLALFVALLGRMTGQRDLPVGTPISGRRQPEVEGLVGFFLNTLVIRAGLPERGTFRALVGQVRTLALEAYAHQDIPFEKLVEELSPRRSLSHSPLFQVLFVLLHQDAGMESSPEGLAASPFPVERGTSKFDLTLTMFAGGAGGDAFSGILEYATDLFDRPTLARLAEHLGTLASAVSAAPDEDLAALPWLAGAARHQLLAEWNDTAHPLPDSSLHQLFERQAERTPDAAAVGFGDHWLTYGELARRAGRLARHLRRLGVGPESRVAIGLDRSLEMVTGVLGVLTAGAAYVPLDPALPRERRVYMLESSGAEVLLTRSGLMSEGGELSHERVRSVCLDGPVLGGPDALPGGPLPDSGCLAYVIYTSGSTGRPKGVALPRLALSNLIDWHLRHFLGGVRTLQLASLSFDVSFLEM